jgi:hypothetical protein
MALTEVAGQLAYNHVIQDLSQRNVPESFLRNYYSDRYFYHGESGYGLILPERVLYTTTENGDYLWICPVEPQIKHYNDPWLNPPSGWTYINALPGDAVKEVLEFTGNIRREIRLQGSVLVRPERLRQP